MTQIVIPDSPLKTVLDFLRDGLAAAGDPVRVASLVPATHPGDLVTISHTGGAVPDPVTAVPTFAVQAWAPKNQIRRAESRAYLALSILENAPYAVARAFDCNAGPYEFPDDKGKYERYQFVCQLWLARRLR